MRFDSHVHTGYTVPAYYDSMIGKLIVHKRSRREAIGAMLQALTELQIEGIHTTAQFHKKILTHSAFVDASIDTTFVERTFMSSAAQQGRPRPCEC